MNISSPLEIAQLAWGDAMPDWVKVLAVECTKTSQAKVAKRLNRSASLVSTVLRAKYPGDMQAVEEIVNDGSWHLLALDMPGLDRCEAPRTRERRVSMD